MLHKKGCTMKTCTGRFVQGNCVQEYDLQTIVLQRKMMYGNTDVQDNMHDK